MAIEARLIELEAPELATKVKTLEAKFMTTVSKLEARIKILEDENVNLESRLRDYNKVRDEEVTSESALTEKENEQEK